MKISNELRLSLSMLIWAAIFLTPFTTTTVMELLTSNVSSEEGISIAILWVLATLSWGYICFAITFLLNYLYLKLKA